MNFKVIITKDGVETNSASFNTESEAQSFLDIHNEMGSFQTVDKVVEPVLDLEGNEIAPGYVIAATHVATITDVTAELATEAEKQAKIAAGKAAREACQKVLDFVAGENLSQSLTIEQITELQQTFAQAEAALRAGRPSFAKYFINAIEADGTLVTEATKAACLELLAGY